MPLIWTKTGSFKVDGYDSEADLEAAILDVQDLLFGPSRIYLDVKRKIGARGGTRNIPDGYLNDLNGPRPRLHVVENELAAHEPLRHIAVQILQFSLSFESEPRAVKRILWEALENAPAAKARCEAYAVQNGLRNLDYFLEYLVFEAPFSALVIIDEIHEDLETILAKRFQFGVEVLQLARYRNSNGECVYHFEPFLADLAVQEPAAVSDKTDTAQEPSASEVDTVVVPAREEGFREVFLGENRWYEVRIHGTMRPQIKYAAAYQVAPVMAITHIAPVKSIEPWKDSGKYVLNFSDPAREIGPITLVQKGRVKALQNLRYTTRKRLETAKTLDDVW